MLEEVQKEIVINPVFIKNKIIIMDFLEYLSNHCDSMAHNQFVKNGPNNSYNSLSFTKNYLKTIKNTLEKL